MQTPAEVRLINQVASCLDGAGSGPVLNIGAGTSSVIEDSLSSAGRRFVVDRLDVDDCRVPHPAVRDCYIASVESIPLPDGAYSVAFANYVLEHVEDLPAAAREIARVLQPGGRFVVSAPNPGAPEFRLSRVTPLWFHRYVRETNEAGHGAHETHYAYGSIRHLADIFRAAGMEVDEVAFYPNTYSYLNRTPLLGPLARAYDAAVRRLGWRGLMGNVCLTFKKPLAAATASSNGAGATALAEPETARHPA